MDEINVVREQVLAAWSSESARRPSTGSEAWPIGQPSSTEQRMVAILEQQIENASLREAASRVEVEALRETVTLLQGRMRALEEAQTLVVVVREIDRQEAKAELQTFFQEQEQAYPSDAAVALRLDTALVRELCDELADEGLILFEGAGE